MALIQLGSWVGSCDECEARACSGVFFMTPRGPQRPICADCLRHTTRAIDQAAATLRARAITASES